MSWVFPLILVFGFPIWNVWREHGLHKEFERNEKHEAPETHQLKWDMRHIREDISLLCHIMFVIAGLLAYLALK